VGGCKELKTQQNHYVPLTIHMDELLKISGKQSMERTGKKTQENRNNAFKNAITS
jgi:hypothetical protein